MTLCPQWLIHGIRGPVIASDHNKPLFWSLPQPLLAWQDKDDYDCSKARGPWQLSPTGLTWFPSWAIANWALAHVGPKCTHWLSRALGRFQFCLERFSPSIKGLNHSEQEGRTFSLYMTPFLRNWASNSWLCYRLKKSVSSVLFNFVNIRVHYKNTSVILTYFWNAFS